MTTEIFFANTDSDIEACFAAFKELRPHLSQTEFLPQIRRQELQGYQILALRHEGIIKSAAGFRFSEYLAWGKILYIDDLTTVTSARANGYAGQLMDWLIGHAKAQQCKGLHLDTGYARHDAHRLYLRKKLLLTSHHMSLVLADN
jgi:GNAT superfamily N-acetyltransferase